MKRFSGEGKNPLLFAACDLKGLQVFSNAEFGSVRSITVNGEPYFVGKDVAEILGYANTRDALAKHVDEEDRMDGVAIRDSIGREQTPVLINESGLYSLILSSRLPITADNSNTPPQMAQP